VRDAAFGRRGIAPRASRRARPAAPENRPAAGSTAFAQDAFAQPDFASVEPFEAAARELSPEEELLAWKAERRRERFARIAWRQISLMAGLCFGIAGFVLPESANDALSWLFYALAAASFAAGFLKRKAAAAA
jgi:hypothetical protein